MSDTAADSDQGPQYSDLDRKAKIKIGVTVIARILLAWVLFGVIYVVMPIGKDAFSPAWFLLGMIVVFVVMMWYSLRRIARANMPQIRAVQVAMVSVGFYLFAFAALYLSLSDADHANFNTILTHTNAFYFTVTVFTTVGFGDIAPNSQSAQLIVTVQMLLNLLFLYVGVRLILSIGKRRAAEVHSGRVPDSGIN